MDELFKTLLTGYSAPVWLITIAIAYKLFNLEKAVSKIFEKIVFPYFENRNDAAAHVVRGLVLEDVVYSRYMQIARHLISNAWTVLVQVRTGHIARDDIEAKLRTHAHASVENARQALGMYHSGGGVPLSCHLENLTEERKANFYAPIKAEIIKQSEGEGLGYESVREVILRESDALLSEAIDEILTHKKT